MGVVGLIFGIISLITCWLGWIPFAGPVICFISGLIGLIGIILSAVGISSAKKNNKSGGAAIAGLVLSIIGSVIADAGFFACGGMAALMMFL